MPAAIQSIINKEKQSIKMRADDRDLKSLLMEL